MNKNHVIIPTSTTRHFFPPDLDKTLLPHNGRIVLPIGNKEGTYRFSDGDVYLRIPGLKNARTITIVHSGYPNPNDGLTEIFYMLDIIKDYNLQGCRVRVLFTTIAYGRQDKKFYAGELNAARRLIFNLTHLHGVDEVLTIDAHFAGEKWVKEFPVRNYSAVEQLTDVVEKSHPNIVFVTPDMGSARRTHIKGAKKKRKGSFDVDINFDDTLASRVHDRDIAVVDDMLSSGTTMEEFRLKAKAAGAKRIFALITHGIGRSGIELVRSRYDGLFMTNTVHQVESNVDVTGLVWYIIGNC